MGAMHLSMAFIFTWYLFTFGGDAIRFWDLTAAYPVEGKSWADFWGTRTDFIQWVNYPFSRWLGLPFWFGNLMYAILTFWALLRLYQYTASVVLLRAGGERWIFPLQVLFLSPTAHFWTAGVGKEALAFVGLVCFALAWTGRKHALIYLLVGVSLSYMIRPLQGAVLVAFVPWWIYQSSLPRSSKWALGLLCLALSIPIVQFILLISHVEQFSWAGIQGFFQGQQEFLKGFEAGSYVEMQDYQAWEILGTFLFRPFLWEARNILEFASGLENLLLLIALPIFLCTFFLPRFPRTLWPVWLGSLIIISIYAFSLNNWGIMMRMKSIFLPFVYIGFIWGLQTLVVTCAQKDKN